MRSFVVADTHASTHPRKHVSGKSGFCACAPVCACTWPACFFRYALFLFVLYAIFILLVLLAEGGLL